MNKESKTQNNESKLISPDQILESEEKRLFSRSLFARKDERNNIIITDSPDGLPSSSSGMIRTKIMELDYLFQPNFKQLPHQSLDHTKFRKFDEFSKVIAITHKWLSRYHPDPNNIKLGELKSRVARFRNNDVGIFLDYYCIPQKIDFNGQKLSMNMSGSFELCDPQSDRIIIDDRYDKLKALDGITNVNLVYLYSHDHLFMNEDLPMSSGWCVFEMIIGFLRNRNSSIIDKLIVVNPLIKQLKLMNADYHAVLSGVFSQLVFSNGEDKNNVPQFLMNLLMLSDVIDTSEFVREEITLTIFRQYSYECIPMLSNNSEHTEESKIIHNFIMKYPMPDDPIICFIIGFFGLAVMGAGLLCCSYGCYKESQRNHVENKWKSILGTTPFVKSYKMSEQKITNDKIKEISDRHVKLEIDIVRKHSIEIHTHMKNLPEDYILMIKRKYKNLNEFMDNCKKGVIDIDVYRKLSHMNVLEFRLGDVIKDENWSKFYNMNPEFANQYNSVHLT
jgi:hypothetical protein